MNININIKSLIVLITVLISLMSCSTAKQGSNPKTLMWEIKSNSGGVVYILGSIHLADSSLYPLNPVIEQKFDSSDALVLEILIDRISPLEVMNYLTFKDDRTLETELPADIYSKIAEKFEANSIPKYMYNKFKPWFAVMFLQSDSYKNAGFSAAEGIDMHFLSKARQKEMEVMEIESLESQMKVMDELGEYTGDYLKFVLDDTNTANESVNELITAWKNGDDKALIELANQGSDKEDFGIIMEKLNFKRNEQMVSKIYDYLKTNKKYFVIVGAAHVVGDRGIIDLLNKNELLKVKRY